MATELHEADQRLQLMVRLEILAFTSEKQSYPHEVMCAMYGRM
jgi:hypothetical protein